MSRPLWQKLGFLTPDAYTAQQELWALHARLLAVQAEVFAALAAQTAEPSWGASLGEAAGRAAELADELGAEAGRDALLVAHEDTLLAEWLAVLDEVLASGHVPSLLVTGHGPLGAYPRLVLELLREVAGPHAAAFCERILAADDHLLLARLFAMGTPAPGERDALRRLLRHLHGGLAQVLAARRQELHTLGVDGEVLAEQAGERVRAIHHELGLKCTRADVAAGRPPG